MSFCAWLSSGVSAVPGSVMVMMTVEMVLMRITPPSVEEVRLSNPPSP